MSRLEKYKGYGIDVDSDGTFKAYTTEPDPFDKTKSEVFTEEIASDKTLEGLKKQLDVVVKAKLGQSCYVYNTEEYFPGKISSVKGKAYSGVHDYRVLWKQGNQNRREELEATEICKDTPENKQRFTEIASIEKDIKALEKRKEKLEDQLEHFTDKELIGHEGEKEKVPS